MTTRWEPGNMPLFIDITVKLEAHIYFNKDKVDEELSSIPWSPLSLQ